MNVVLCVCVRVHISFLLLQVQRSSVSFSHSPIEIQVSHVFGRFLRGTHFLIVEDHPPVERRDHYIHKKFLDNTQVMEFNMYTTKGAF